jgi:hypothetical protein
MATTISPYFELSWAVLSTIGLNNVLIGFMVAGITGGFSVVLLVPIITSAGCALANGLCYVAWIAEYSVVSKAVAAVFATFGWLVSAKLRQKANGTGILYRLNPQLSHIDAALLLFQSPSPSPS